MRAMANRSPHTRTRDQPRITLKNACVGSEPGWKQGQAAISVPRLVFLYAYVHTCIRTCVLRTYTHVHTGGVYALSPTAWAEVPLAAKPHLGLTIPAHGGSFAP